MDLYIGDQDMRHRGHGASIVRAFVRDVVFQRYDVGLCVIGPAETNAAAIRAYEKAGFHHFKTVRVPGEANAEHLMRLRREELRP